MTFEVSAAPAPAGEVPAAWRGAIQSHLHPQENVCACLEVDLDERLHFVPSVVLATNERLISLGQGGSSQDWPYRADLTLGHHDHAGVGHLELLDAHGLLQRWRFTLGQNLQALRLVDQFMAQQNSSVSGQPVAPAAQAVCPSCKAPLEPDQEECHRPPGRCCACGALPSPTGASCCLVLCSCCWAPLPARCRPT